jgi:hypothetical protein
MNPFEDLEYGEEDINAGFDKEFDDVEEQLPEGATEGVF